MRICWHKYTIKCYNIEFWAICAKTNSTRANNNGMADGSEQKNHKKTLLSNLSTIKSVLVDVELGIVFCKGCVWFTVIVPVIDKYVCRCCVYSSPLSFSGHFAIPYIDTVSSNTNASFRNYSLFSSISMCCLCLYKGWENEQRQQPATAVLLICFRPTSLLVSYARCSLSKLKSRKHFIIMHIIICWWCFAKHQL